jgi:hypothetical protein
MVPGERHSCFVGVITWVDKVLVVGVAWASVMDSGGRYLMS